MQTALRSSSVPFGDLGSMTLEIQSELDEVWRSVLSSSAFIGGDLVERFERAWASACHVAHAVGVANGTDAIQLALRALGIGPGDEVIVPANTFVASVEAVVLAGATPRFVDVDPRTLLVTPEIVANAIGARTAAVIPVHLYGNVADMPRICQVASAAGIAVVEDASQAHGAAWNGQPAGSFGDAGAFSFYPGKNLGAFGDAGAIVTNDASLAAKVRSMADHGRASGQRYVHPLVGTNSRLDALQAGVLSVKLSRLPLWNKGRADAAGWYTTYLPSRASLIGHDSAVTPSWHLAVVQVADRPQVRRHLTAAGVETGIHYPIPCHRQQAFSRWSPGILPVTEGAAQSIVSLPLFPHMTEEQVALTCRSLAAAFEGIDRAD
jgi:dTDP-4-amino-4,6-dideoxygalactose transaminase